VNAILSTLQPELALLHQAIEDVRNVVVDRAVQIENAVLNRLAQSDATREQQLARLHAQSKEAMRARDVGKMLPAFARELSKLSLSPDGAAAARDELSSGELDITIEKLKQLKFHMSEEPSRSTAAQPTVAVHCDRQGTETDKLHGHEPQLPMSPLAPSRDTMTVDSVDGWTLDYAIVPERPQDDGLPVPPRPLKSRDLPMPDPDPQAPALRILEDILKVVREHVDDLPPTWSVRYWCRSDGQQRYRDIEKGESGWEGVDRLARLLTSRLDCLADNVQWQLLFWPYTGREEPLIPPLSTWTVMFEGFVSAAEAIDAVADAAESYIVKFLSGSTLLVVMGTHKAWQATFDRAHASASSTSPALTDVATTVENTAAFWVSHPREIDYAKFDEYIRIVDACSSFELRDMSVVLRTPTADSLLFCMAGAPRWATCPISHEIMTDPVVCSADGRSYDRSSIPSVEAMFTDRECVAPFPPVQCGFIIICVHLPTCSVKIQACVALDCMSLHFSLHRCVSRC
jgi:hypothetical protein